jgi:hypothetical protein
MKQDRTFERGVTRREGEKPCGRNVPGAANRGEVDSLGPERRRGVRLHERSRNARILLWQSLGKRRAGWVLPYRGHNHMRGAVGLARWQAGRFGRPHGAATFIYKCREARSGIA